MSPSSPPGSDISEFAAWEAEHPSQVNEESERERSLADMVRPERMQIWGDRDSSNDARSSDEEEIVKDVCERVVVEISSEESESEIESDAEDDLPPSSQPRAESTSEDEDDDEHATKESSGKQYVAETAIEISSEDEGDNDEEAEEEDKFAGFDVTPEDKEFLTGLLDVAPPEEVEKLTGKSRRSSDPFEDIMPDKRTTKNVGGFAKDHPFRKQAAWTTVELQEYMDDVYEFAMAAGMSEFHAGLEVQKATGAWKVEKGLPLDNEELETERTQKVKNLEFAVDFNRHELNTAKEQLHEGRNGKHKKRKRDPEGSKFFNFEDARSVEMKSEDRDSTREAKRRKRAEKRAEKKARRRARRQEKENALSAASEATPPGFKAHHTEVKSAVSQKTRSTALPASKMGSSQTRLTAEDSLPAKQNSSQVEKPKLQSSQSYYAEEESTSPSPKHVTRDNISLSTADEKSVGLELKKKRREKIEKKKLKKKAKLGPKTSEYFAKSKSSGLPFSTILKDDIGPPPRAMDVEGPKPQRNYEAEIHIKKMAEEAKQVVTNAPVLIKEVSMEQKGLKASSKTNAEPEVVQKKKKNRNRKRHRNKNRLADQPPGEYEESGNVAIQGEDGKGDLPLKKDHDRLQKGNLDEDADKGQDGDLTARKKSIIDLENSGDLYLAKIVSQSTPDADKRGNRPSKRRDRGRKSKSKEEDLEMPDVGESAVAEPSAAELPPVQSASVVSNIVLESIEPDKLSSKKKRKRSKSKSKRENIELGEVGESADIQPLTELADTNSKNSKEERRGHAHKRAPSVDAISLDTCPTNQSSKVHHSQ